MSEPEFPYRPPVGRDQLEWASRKAMGAAGLLRQAMRAPTAGRLLDAESKLLQALGALQEARETLAGGGEGASSE